jgi:hypothetical protein
VLGFDGYSRLGTADARRIAAVLEREGWERGKPTASTGDHDPWSCTICERDYFGPQMLSVLGVIDDPRTPGSAGPVAVALVCAPCAGGRTEEMEREIARTFGLARRN